MKYLNELEVNYYIMSPGKNDSHNWSAVTTDWEIFNQNCWKKFNGSAQFPEVQ